MIFSDLWQTTYYTAFKSETQAKNLIKYIGTKLLRCLVSTIKISQSAANSVYDLLRYKILPKILISIGTYLF